MNKHITPDDYVCCLYARDECVYARDECVYAKDECETVV
jgi:hypothetical protein